MTKTAHPRRRSHLNLETLEDRVVPALLGQQLFPVDNAWNQKITTAPVAANSAAIMNSITTNYGNGRLHPDFGQNYHTAGGDLYGISYNVVHGNSVGKTTVIIDGYPDESDLLQVPIPANVVIEGDFQTGPRVGVDNRGDSHLLIFDVDNNIAYEFYRASRPSENSDGKWHADQESVWDMKTNSFRTLGWTSVDAAGLSVLAGLVRPDEGLPVSQGGQGVINHAIRFTLQNAVILDQFLYPASHTANPGNTNTSVMPPMGARFRLKSTVDISQLNPQAKIIAQAMKDYGMIVADNGSNFFFSGAAEAVDTANNRTLTWNDNDIQDTTRGLKSLHFGDFEIVNLTPIVTDLSAHTGAAGSSVTIVGQNFSGAAGRLQVFFGNTPATSVTYVSDTQIVAVAPTGSGVVDVRVQSGVTTGPNPDNVKNTIFGYGLSATSTADRFTFGVPGPNQAPTVVTAAAAGSNPVIGLTTNLSALGADDGGETALRYTWSATGPGTAAFTPNASNAAKASSVAVNSAGSYTFTVTIADASGLTTTSSVIVTFNVNQAPTIATAAAAGGNPVTGLTTTLTVLGADDGGEPNLRYTWSATGPGTAAFTPNGTNAAKNTTAAVSVPGTYTFTATITDGPGLTRTNAVTVTFAPAPDTTPPTSTVARLPAFETVSSFTVAWSGSDAGSGVASYQVYVSIDGGAFSLWQSATTLKKATYTGSPGHRYGFYSIATDAVGNRQPTPSGAQASTRLVKVAANPPANLSAAASSYSHSDEQYSNFITRAYNTYLGRGPDAPGLAGWLSQMRTGQVSDENLESQFVGSVEYIAGHGGAGAGWVTGMYQDLLGRTPAPSEVNGWVGQLNAGVSPVSIAFGFAASSEREGIRVRQNYQMYLGRTPAQSEVDFWVDQFVSHGMTTETMAANFVASSEFFNGSNQGASDYDVWTTRAFLAILNRTPTNVSIESGSLLAPANLGSLASQFTHSDESYTVFITQAYVAYLGRTPDSAGLSSWLSAMRAGQVTDEQLEASVIGSSEYIASHGGAGAAWIASLYRDLLGRAATTAEINGGLGQLNAGTPTVTIALSLARGSERETIRVRDNYQRYLGRDASSSEINLWVDQFVNHGMTSETMAAGFIGSDEYFRGAAKGSADAVRWLDAAFADVNRRDITQSELDALVPQVK